MVRGRKRKDTVPIVPRKEIRVNEKKSCVLCNSKMIPKEITDDGYIYWRCSNLNCGLLTKSPKSK